MKKLLLAILAVGLLLFIVGCPPSTDVSDQFGPGPDRTGVTNGDEQPDDEAVTPPEEGAGEDVEEGTTDEGSEAAEPEEGTAENGENPEKEPIDTA